MRLSKKNLRKMMSIVVNGRTELEVPWQTMAKLQMVGKYDQEHTQNGLTSNLPDLTEPPEQGALPNHMGIRTMI